MIVPLNEKVNTLFSKSVYISQVVSSVLQMYHNAKSCFKCTEETLQIPEGSNQRPSYFPLAPQHPKIPALLLACTDHDLGSPTGCQKWKSLAQTYKQREEGAGSIPSLPACLKASSPGPSSTMSALCSAHLWGIKGFLLLLFPGCCTIPCLFPNLYNLFIRTIKDEISFLAGTLPDAANNTKSGQ